MKYWRLLRSSEEHWQGEFPKEDPAGTYLHLILDAESPVNALSSAVLLELEAITGALRSAKGVRALFFWSAKSEHFIAGADIEEIEAIDDATSGFEKAKLGQNIIGALSTLHYPTFAMIRGTCLGGGLELALALTYRISANDSETRIGLPEVNLGIIPGFGGTQRLPRLIGLRAALELIVAAKRLPARAAYAKGIIDVLVPHEGFRLSAVRAAIAILNDKGRSVVRRRKSLAGGVRSLLLEGNPLGRGIIKKISRRAVLARTKGHYPAALAAVTAVLDGAALQLPQALELEARLCGDLIAGPVSKNLIRIFHWSEAARHWSSPVLDPRADLPQTPLAAVLGAGVMGAGIAALLLERGIETRIRDLNSQAVQRGLQQIGAHLSKLGKDRRLSAAERNALFARLTHTTQLTGFARADFVIEAILERLDIKQRAVADLEPQLKSEAIFASNTSALSITALQAGARSPERVVGMHFFNPVHRMPLVEVIPGEQTAPWVVARTVALTQRLGKYPVVVRDSPGFLVNRLLLPYLDCALRLLDQRIPGVRIDRVAERFGLPMGPFRLLDEVGIDIAVEVAATLHKAFGKRVEPSALLQRMTANGWLGKKKGRGFYLYQGKKEQSWNGDAWPPGETGSASADLSDQDIVNALLDRQVDEAVRCLEERVVELPEHVDLAMILGTGFPPFLGGPLWHADRCGLDRIVHRLDEKAARDGISAPSQRLRDLARGPSSIYAGFRGRQPSIAEPEKTLADL